MTLRPPRALLLTLAATFALGGCSATHHAESIQAAEVQIDAQGRCQLSGAAQEVWRRGLEGVEALIPLAEQEARTDPAGGTKYRGTLLARLVEAPVTGILPVSAETSDTQVSEYSDAALRLVDASLRSEDAHLRALACRVLDAIGDRRTFAAGIEHLARCLGASPPRPEEAHEALVALGGLAIPNGALIRSRAEGPLAFDPPWAEVLRAELIDAEHDAPTRIAQLRAWLAGRDDLPPQALWSER